MSDWKYMAIVGPSWELSKDFYKQHVSPLLVQPNTGAHTHTHTHTHACMHKQTTIFGAHNMIGTGEWSLLLYLDILLSVPVPAEVITDNGTIWLTRQ